MGICGKIKRTSSLSECCRPADWGTSLEGDNDKEIQLGGHTIGNLAVFIGGGSGWGVWQHTKSALRSYNFDLRWRWCDSLCAHCRRFGACAFSFCSISVLFLVKSTIASVTLVTAILPTSGTHRAVPEVSPARLTRHRSSANDDRWLFCEDIDAVAP